MAKAPTNAGFHLGRHEISPFIVSIPPLNFDFKQQLSQVVPQNIEIGAKPFSAGVGGFQPQS
jgi:hypothetical protein